MSEHLAPLREAVDALDAVWADAGSAQALSRRQLIAVNDAVGVLRRRLDGLKRPMFSAAPMRGAALG